MWLLRAQAVLRVGPHPRAGLGWAGHPIPPAAVDGDGSGGGGGGALGDFERLHGFFAPMSASLSTGSSCRGTACKPRGVRVLAR
jgi:hypothetical protein